LRAWRLPAGLGQGVLKLHRSLDDRFRVRESFDFLATVREGNHQFVIETIALPSYLVMQVSVMLLKEPQHAHGLSAYALAAVELE
jgi:hypothetical protein